MTDLKKTTDEKMKTPELLEKLHNHYKAKPSGSWAFITQLRNGTGWNSTTRTADAMAMGLWPSSGLELIGFELKVSRSDWLHEVKQPDKHQEMKQFCDRWYLVVPDESIIKEGELPDDWGLMVASGRGRTIKIKKEAPKLSPVDVDRLLLASIFRNITEKMIPYEMHQNALKQTEKYATENALRSQKTRLAEAVIIEQQIKEFEEITGLKFKEWNRDHLELAATVKKALEGRYDKMEDKLEALAKRAENLAKYARGENVSAWDL